MKREQEPQKPDAHFEQRRALMDKLIKGERLHPIECLKIAYSVAHSLGEQLEVIHQLPGVVAYPADLKLTLDKKVFGQNIQWQETQRLTSEEKTDSLSVAEEEMPLGRRLEFKRRKSGAMLDLPKIDNPLHIWLVQIPREYRPKTCRAVISVQGQYFLVDFGGNFGIFNKNNEAHRSKTMVIPESPNIVLPFYLHLTLLFPELLPLLALDRSSMMLYALMAVIGAPLHLYPIALGRNMPPYSFNRDRMEVYNWSADDDYRDIERQLLQSSIVGLDISSKLKVLQEEKVRSQNFIASPVLADY